METEGSLNKLNICLENWLTLSVSPVSGYSDLIRPLATPALCWDLSVSIYSIYFCALSPESGSLRLAIGLSLTELAWSLEFLSPHAFDLARDSR